ncbi:MAG: hypothetical protein KC656_01580 [Myxococcales bacterium]|nr:hypothetical protein [Myxococcales bacterium]
MMRGIGNILIGLVFIGGGLSGQLALLGTDSPMALAFVGLLILGFGVYQAMSGPRDEEA